MKRPLLYALAAFVVTALVVALIGAVRATLGARRQRDAAERDALAWVARAIADSVERATLARRNAELVTLNAVLRAESDRLAARVAADDRRIVTLDRDLAAARARIAVAPTATDSAARCLTTLAVCDSARIALATTVARRDTALARAATRTAHDSARLATFAAQLARTGGVVDTGRTRVVPGLTTALANARRCYWLYIIPCPTPGEAFVGGVVVGAVVTWRARP